MGERRDAQEWQGDTNNVNKRDDVYTKLRRRLSVCHQQFLQIKARVFRVRYHCSTQFHISKHRRTRKERVHTASVLGSFLLSSKCLFCLSHQTFPVVYGVVDLVLLMLGLERSAVVPAVCNAKHESRIPDNLGKPTRKPTYSIKERNREYTLTVGEAMKLFL